jgi:hypothetical protein
MTETGTVVIGAMTTAATTGGMTMTEGITATMIVAMMINAMTTIMIVTIEVTESS